MATISIQITQRHNTWTDTVNQIMKLNLLWWMQYNLDLKSLRICHKVQNHYTSKTKLRKNLSSYKTRKQTSKRMENSFNNKSLLRVVQLALLLQSQLSICQANPVHKRHQRTQINFFLLLPSYRKFTFHNASALN